MPSRSRARSAPVRVVPPTRSGRLTTVFALAMVVALAAAAAGCSDVTLPAPSRARTSPGIGHHRGAREPTTTVPPTTTTTEPALPVTPVQWTQCGDLQCGSVTVPLDYRHPGGPTLQIALARHPAEVPSERIGSLVINPGGPGASGIDDLPNELSVLTPDLLDRFDIVSFDPRGVERSSPVTCTPSADTRTSGSPVDLVPTTPAARRVLLRADREFAEECEHGSGSILPYVGTVDTARDLDRIRAALGDAGLTFIGHSYGTLLGATYAELFPTHVRAMVLDGAIDPALSTVAYGIDQADSLESELQSFFAWCSPGSGCPWHPTGDPTTSLLHLIRTSQARPVAAAAGAMAGPGDLYDALLSGLQSSSAWPALAAALAAAATGQGAPASSMAGRYRTGGSTNAADAEQAIDCLDHPVSRNPSRYPALAQRFARSAPVFGPLLAWDLLGCAIWPVPPTRVPAPASDPGAPPILVVGTTGDPVTPYSWAVGLAGELTGGRLLTWRGQSHVAYYYSPCVRYYVQAYLIAGTLPAPGTTCTD